jgi:ketosteroid isomerase-like protein
MTRRTKGAALLLTAIAILSHGSPAAAADGPARDAVMQLEREFNDAVLSRDEAALDRLLADDFSSGGQEVFDKRERIERIVSGIPPKAVKVDEMSVRLYGDSAVATGLTTSEWLSPEGAGTRTHRWSNVWVRGESGWRIVHSVSTEVMLGSGEGC